VYNNVKKWGMACVISVLIILSPLWTTLIAILLGTSVPSFVEFITFIDKYISVCGVFFFVISIYQFSKLTANSENESNTVKEEL